MQPDRQKQRNRHRQTDVHIDILKQTSRNTEQKETFKKYSKAIIL